MIKTIWKYPIKTTDTQELAVPERAHILCIQVQEGFGPCLWALVNAENKLETRTIETFDTGHPMHVDMGVDRAYIGTYQLHGGALVFHVFERIN